MTFNHFMDYQQVDFLILEMKKIIYIKFGLSSSRSNDVFQLLEEKFTSSIVLSHEITGFQKTFKTLTKLDIA